MRQDDQGVQQEVRQHHAECYYLVHRVPEKTKMDSYQGNCRQTNPERRLTSSTCSLCAKVNTNGSWCTKFCILRPLTSKRASEVAYQLLDIYLLLGAPSIIQSDNGSEFTAQVITELKQMWPDLVIVHDAQFQQAKIMVKRCRIVFSSVQIGSNVTEEL